MKIQSSNSW